MNTEVNNVEAVSALLDKINGVFQSYANETHKVELTNLDLVHLKIAIERTLESYLKEGYTETQIVTSEPGSLFGNLLELRELFIYLSVAPAA